MIKEEKKIQGLDPIIFTSNYVTGPGKTCCCYKKQIYRFEGFKDEHESFRMIQIKPGLELNITNLRTSEKQNVTYEIEKAPVCFSFMLSGESRNCVRTTTGECRCLHVTSGMNCISCLENICGDLEFIPENGIVAVGINIDPTLLRSYLGNGILSKDNEIKQLIMEEGTRQFFKLDKMSPEMFNAAFRIVNCPYPSPAKELFLESKVMELLSLRIAQFIEENKKRDKTKFTLSVKDKRCICNARETLLSDILNPPTLGDLARKSGTNEFKLKKGFKEMYGSTVFNYLRSVRMEKARQMLSDGIYNVSEAASRVGYSNVSHFSRAYRKQYGINPGKQKNQIEHTS